MRKEKKEKREGKGKKRKEKREKEKKRDGKREKEKSFMLKLLPKPHLMVRLVKIQNYPFEHRSGSLMESCVPLMQSTEKFQV